MAEIEIEKKKPIWPWIIAAIVIAGIVYLLAFAGDNDTDDASEMASETSEMVSGDASQENDAYDATVADFDEALMAYKEYLENPNMGLDHEYSNGALLKLIAAVRTKAEVLQIDIEADLMEAEKKAQDITKDPYEVDHANKIKKSGEIIAKAIQTIQTEKFPDLETKFDAMNTSLTKIKPKEKTLNQKTDVKNFFKQAAELLTQMNQ